MMHHLHEHLTADPPTASNQTCSLLSGHLVGVTVPQSEWDKLERWEERVTHAAMSLRNDMARDRANYSAGFKR